MKKLHITTDERAALDRSGCWCLAMAEQVMRRNGCNFDDIERINNHYESHRWGSNADRAYRARAVRQAIARVAADPAAYILPVEVSA